MRNIVKDRYNTVTTATPTRQFANVEANYAQITWADPVAKTASTTLTYALVGSSGISPEFYAGLSVLQTDPLYRIIGVNSWVYSSSTPTRRFWGRTNYLTVTTAIQRNEWNNITWLADKVYQALELS